MKSLKDWENLIKMFKINRIRTKKAPSDSIASEIFYYLRRIIKYTKYKKVFQISQLFCRLDRNFLYFWALPSSTSDSEKIPDSKLRSEKIQLSVQFGSEKKIEFWSRWPSHRAISDRVYCLIVSYLTFGRIDSCNFLVS